MCTLLSYACSAASASYHQRLWPAEIIILTLYSSTCKCKFPLHSVLPTRKSSSAYLVGCIPPQPFIVDGYLSHLIHYLFQPSIIHTTIAHCTLLQKNTSFKKPQQSQRPTSTQHKKFMLYIAHSFALHCILKCVAAIEINETHPD
jgi:hypothetical protein